MLSSPTADPDLNSLWWESTGAEEDLQGIPFVGKSGKLLTAMLDSLGLVRRRDCVILNVLKCRPPRNRNPQPEEIVCCGHWLARQLELLKPMCFSSQGDLPFRRF